MWISYASSEINVFHPICEVALNTALVRLKLDKAYMVKHHQMAGSLEMDYAIMNKSTGKFLCIIEVKRTPADVQSTRNQYQAMSYVQMEVPVLERPFYILTNLEYMYTFRYESSRSRVFQQMLEPGLIFVGLFMDHTKAEFLDKLIAAFAAQLDSFINNTYQYLITLDQFAELMKSLKNQDKTWKSSLAILLYEYIRGSFHSVGRSGLRDVRTYRNDIQLLCDEAVKINFAGIFKYDPMHYEARLTLDSNIVSNLYEFGKNNITADTIADVLHGIACEGNEHKGQVSTDTELAKLVSIVSKSLFDETRPLRLVCDPAAGSGSLISSAIDVYHLHSNQIMANDVDPYLIELLSLRLGLNFPKLIEQSNSPFVTSQNILDMTPSDFEEVDVVLLNPPYIAGISCSAEKPLFAQKIREVTGQHAWTHIGQMGLEGLFIELVCALVKPGTIISCILPKQLLVSRGDEAIALRRFLLTHFGLSIICNYPGKDLFGSVTKDTCIFAGIKGVESEHVKIYSCLDSVANINLDEFLHSLKASELAHSKFTSLISGVEGMRMDVNTLHATIGSGWRMINNELCEAIDFIDQYLASHVAIDRIDKLGFKATKGYIGNNGGNDLLYADSKEAFFEKVKDKVTGFRPGLRNAKFNSIVVGDGDSKFLDHEMLINSDDLNEIIDDYMALTPIHSGRQIKKVKTSAELLSILKKERKKETKSYSVLIPRNLRKTGRIHVTDKTTFVSTNFIILNTITERNAKIVASWMLTLFYQLILEVSSKDQEGTRKIEIKDILPTYAPQISVIGHALYQELSGLFNCIAFIQLKQPVISAIDRFWARVLFGRDANLRLEEAQRLLQYAARRRDQN